MEQILSQAAVFRSRFWLKSALGFIYLIRCGFAGVDFSFHFHLILMVGTLLPKCLFEYLKKNIQF